MPAARVGSSACGLFSRGRWVERADGPASCPHPQRVPRLRVCRTPCLGSVLHAHKLLHQFLAARPCPAGALRSASSVASAFVSVSSSSGAHHVGIRLQAALSSPPRAAPAAPAACPQPPVLATPGSAGWRGRAAGRRRRARGRGARQRGAQAARGKGRLNFLYSTQDGLAGSAAMCSAASITSRPQVL